VSDQQNRPTNPFEAAKRRSGVHVTLDIHDVQAERPEWDEARAQVFLERHAAMIAQSMLIAGSQIVRELLEDDDAD